MNIHLRLPIVHRVGLLPSLSINNFKLFSNNFGLVGELKIKWRNVRGNTRLIIFPDKQGESINYLKDRGSKAVPSAIGSRLNLGVKT